MNHPEEKPRTSNAEGSEEAGGHEGPVGGTEPLAAGVEGNVAVGALGVVVGRGELGARSVEASLGDQRGRGTGSGAGKHLQLQQWSIRSMFARGAMAERLN